MILGEVLVGLSMGLLVQVVFAAVEFCGQLVGTQMGLSVANLFDPTAGQMPLLAMFQNLLAMLLFVSLGIHHTFIRAIVDSYALLPVGNWHMSKGLMQFFITATSGLFVLAIKLAAPVMVALLMTSVLLGVMARSFPQMNIFMISFPLSIGIGFVVLGLSLLAFASTLQAGFGELTIQLRTLFRLLA
jgi:flagellar biosynthetic protein FliR